MQFSSIITQISKDGSGICEHEGIKYFVFGAWINDEGVFEVLEKKHPNKKFGYAKLVELKVPSQNRIENKCPHWGIESAQCQGCSWTFVEYKSQLDQKEKRLQFSFSRFADFDITNIQKAIIPSPKSWGYRNRISLKSDGKEIGYLNRGSHDLCPISSCPVANENINKTLNEVINTLPNQELTPPAKHKYSLIELDDEKGALFNKKHPFKQANSEINLMMKNWVKEKLKPSHRVLELFCGSGNFTEMISPMVESITAIESYKPALNALKEKALTNVLTKCMDLFRSRPLKIDSNLLFLDPPREGFKDLKKWIDLNPSISEILYISCEADTMAKDLKPLLEAFELVEITPLDHFPQTPHFEVMAYLTKK